MIQLVSKIISWKIQNRLELVIGEFKKLTFLKCINSFVNLKGGPNECICFNELYMDSGATVLCVSWAN